jgi:ABC-2 type transport system permease protein
MQKFLAVVKHEYKKVVLKWSFLIATLMLPVLAGVFSIVPAIIFSLKSEPTRIAVVDPTTKILPRLQANLSGDRLMAKAKQAASEQFKDISASQEEKMRQNAAQFMQDFRLITVPNEGKDVETIRGDLLKRIMSDEIDAYLFIPENIDSPNAVFEYRSRKGGDFVSNDTFTDALNDAVRSQRLADANISEARLAELSAKLNIDSKGIDDKGVEKNNSGTFVASFVIGLMIYILLAIYGQQIMGAVVEEKETRIAEILFSSARPFELMLGKLVGVGLAGLTQLSIWVITAAALIGVIVAQGSFGPVTDAIPAISPLMILGFLVYFLLGFFIYASIFALVGSMVTTVQEGSQFAFPPIMLMLAAFYFCFAVIRDPNSTLSFWVSMAPFLAPITMPVRMLAEMPPLWQIALSITINIAAIAILVWIAARVYRVGMLMYGKRATIPEVWKWIRQT